MFQESDMVIGFWSPVIQFSDVVEFSPMPLYQIAYTTTFYTAPKSRVNTWYEEFDTLMGYSR